MFRFPFIEGGVQSGFAASPDDTVVESQNELWLVLFPLCLSFIILHTHMHTHAAAAWRIFPSISVGGAGVREGILHCAPSNDDCNDGLSIFDKKQHAPH